ncbi:hypothetical protein ABC383_23215 [Noviherbaspirillum sp. 1P10PC]|uniref:hypothetical protein n=1 Tax=Noviherbaspirillum sp. 1P10PC TaxID=3132292 RepID=UPI0039A16B8B
MPDPLLKKLASRNFIAREMVRLFGQEEARRNTTGPMRDAIERIIADMPKRECRPKGTK